MSRPWRDVLAANDPGNAQAVGAWLAHANRHDALLPKVAELITVAAALGARAPSIVGVHVKRAIEQGATGAELYETLALGATIGGMAVLVNGLALFDELGVKAEPAASGRPGCARHGERTQATQG
jgi:alkylhydroperoxidase/carboxymuconolactone decarboxylase family protein YurZ